VVPSTDRIGRTGESRILLVSRQCRELDIDFNGIYALVLSQFDPDIEVRSVTAVEIQNKPARTVVLSFERPEGLDTLDVRAPLGSARVEGT